jgi:hypothetical protein
MQDDAGDYTLLYPIFQDEDKVDLDVIRKQTRLGKPLEDRGFLEMLFKKLGYKLSFRSMDRLKKGSVPK